MEWMAARAPPIPRSEDLSAAPENDLSRLLIGGRALLTRPDALDHLDAAALADVDGRQRQGPVEGVAAGRVRVAVALEAPHLAAGCKEEE